MQHVKIQVTVCTSVYVCPSQHKRAINVHRQQLSGATSTVAATGQYTDVTILTLM